MVILGLGSNIGDRLNNLRLALRQLRQTPGLNVQQISPVYVSDALLPENAPPDWDKPHLNVAIRCNTTLNPEDLLDRLKNIEWSIGRKPEKRHWGPRILDIDILALDNTILKTERLTIPHTNLQNRPFALWPLADVAPDWVFPLPGPNQGKTAAQIVEQWGSRFTGNAPFRTRQLYQRLDAPALVGIINITPDSFSDGGLYLKPDQAIKQAEQLVLNGAEILDIGAESTAPTATAIDPESEWRRLEPVLNELVRVRQQFVLPPKISVDTRHAAVATKALLMGADWINDVTGLDDPAMRAIVAQTQADCVVMHHRRIPEDRTDVLPRHEDSVKNVYAWAKQRLAQLEQAGIARERVIFDPGIGFGKMAEQSLSLLRHAHVFKNLGVRVLVGHSRKTFFSLFTAQSFAERDIETMAATLCLAQQSIDYLRVHNVEMNARGLRMWAALNAK